ncbi:MAG: hypothetical protein MZW92_67155 [Comamonadaceae bacterium]|nr:hypothetical protein [Comamonadaceae bacterium]
MLSDADAAPHPGPDRRALHPEVPEEPGRPHGHALRLGDRLPDDRRRSMSSSHPEFGWAEATARAALMVGAFNLLPVSPGSLVRGFYVLGVWSSRRGTSRTTGWPCRSSFFKIIGYLAFPLQMAYRFPELARFMAGHWATEAVHIVPVFGERGAWLEHAVFDAFYNYPAEPGHPDPEAGRARGGEKPRWWARPGGGARSARRSQRSSTSSSSARPAACPRSTMSGGPCSWRRSGPAFWPSLWSRRKKMGKRIAAGLTAGALVGLGYGLINAYLTPLVPGLAATAAPVVSGGAPALGILWKTFVFTLLAMPGAFLAETLPPSPPSPAPRTGNRG